MRDLRPSGPGVLRLLREPRWLRGLALAVLVALVCCALGRWQWHRREERLAANAPLVQNYDRPAAPRRLGPARGCAGGRLGVWTPVRVTGTYNPDATVLVRNRPRDDQFGYEVLVPSCSPTAPPCSWTAAGCPPGRLRRAARHRPGPAAGRGDRRRPAAAVGGRQARPRARRAGDVHRPRQRHHRRRRPGRRRPAAPAGWVRAAGVGDARLRRGADGRAPPRRAPRRGRGTAPGLHRAVVRVRADRARRVGRGGAPGAAVPRGRRRGRRGRVLGRRGAAGRPARPGAGPRCGAAGPCGAPPAPASARGLSTRPPRTRNWTRASTTGSPFRPPHLDLGAVPPPTEVRPFGCTGSCCVSHRPLCATMGAWTWASVTACTSSPVRPPVSAWPARGCSPTRAGCWCCTRRTRTNWPRWPPPSATPAGCCSSPATSPTPAPRPASSPPPTPASAVWTAPSSPAGPRPPRPSWRPRTARGARPSSPACWGRCGWPVPSGRPPRARGRRWSCCCRAPRAAP